MTSVSDNFIEWKTFLLSRQLNNDYQDMLQEDEILKECSERINQGLLISIPYLQRKYKLSYSGAEKIFAQI